MSAIVALRLEREQLDLANQVIIDCSGYFENLRRDLAGKPASD